ncbi:hypothetical protein C8R46DRAFT_463476 [Mycena filopes]|nr:hypothetical protein C8R46DRAFT_463476 [Mycena filopes]
MPAPSLPDELISEILSPALKVSDEVFANTERVSPFANPDSESTSAYLLVCKSWLRVATPLLYNVVVIRSKAQAKALGLVLAKNTLLGPFIRKIRVEGGYGAPMGTILKCSPNITDLFMTLEVWASDSTSGLCKGLPLINPARLILQFDRRRRSANQMATNLQDALVKSILKWERLTVVEFPHTPVSHLNQWTVVLEALAKAKKLERVKLSPYGLFGAHQLLKPCPLKIMELNDPMSASLLSRLDKAPQIKALVQFAATSPDPRRANVNPPPVIQPWVFSRNPLISAPQEVQESIWERVLYFAIMSPEAPKPSHRRFPRSSPTFPLSFLLVSKTFNRLALPHYYTHVKLRNTIAASNFAAALQQHPALASHVRTLYGYLGYEKHSDSQDPEGDERTAATALLAIFSQTTGLEQVSTYLEGNLRFQADFIDVGFMFMGPSLPWDVFEVMANTSGKTRK